MRRADVRFIRVGDLHMVVETVVMVVTTGALFVVMTVFEVVAVCVRCTRCVMRM